MNYWQTNKMNACQRSFRKYYWARSTCISCVEKLSSQTSVAFYCYIIGLKCIEAQVTYSRYSSRLYGIYVLSHGSKFSTITKKSLEIIISKPIDARSETSNAKHIFPNKGKLYGMLVQVSPLIIFKFIIVSESFSELKGCIYLIQGSLWIFMILEL